ncbi:MAG TPA: AraC family transcriptional regulator [Burkholderiaceae bacterium]|nr:AraC family transcriptional regulator [Burkholderiaceae bacterium]
MERARYGGDFLAWSGGAMFIGSGGGTIAPHAHYALQIAVGAPDGLRVRDGRRGPWLQGAGAVVPSRTVHSLDVAGCGWSAVVFVEPETPAGRALSSRLGRRIEVLDHAAVADRVALVERAWTVTRSADALQEAATGLVAHLSGTAPHAPSDPRVLRAIEYIRGRADDPPSLEEVARAVHLSPGRFRHLFVQETGMPLRTYLLWRKVLRAWDFVMRGESLAGAAQAAGFSDSAHLSRTCRTMFGLPPSALRMSGPLSEGRDRPSR